MSFVKTTITCSGDDRPEVVKNYPPHIAVEKSGATVDTASFQGYRNRQFHGSLCTRIIINTKKKKRSARRIFAVQQLNVIGR